MGGVQLFQARGEVADGAQVGQAAVERGGGAGRTVNRQDRICVMFNTGCEGSVRPGVRVDTEGPPPAGQRI